MNQEQPNTNYGNELTNLTQQFIIFLEQFGRNRGSKFTHVHINVAETIEKLNAWVIILKQSQYKYDGVKRINCYTRNVGQPRYVEQIT